MKPYLLTITLLTACDYTAVRTTIADLDECRKTLERDAGALKRELEAAKAEIEKLKGAE